MEYTFILKNIDAEAVTLEHTVKNTRRGKVIDAGAGNDVQETVTTLEKVSKSDTKALHFLDHRKIPVYYHITMMNYNGKPLPPYSTVPCCECHLKFGTRPIGCPLRYYPHSEAVKKYFTQKNITSDKDDYFETEYIFCSFPCVKRYILDQKNLIKYKNSLTLLALLYHFLTGRTDDIPIAPSWKLLKDYGGPLSIEDFRKSFDKYTYDETINMKRPFMFCSSECIEEKRKKDPTLGISET